MCCLKECLQESRPAAKREFWGKKAWRKKHL